MKQDEFTKNLKRILDAYGERYADITQKLTDKILLHMEKGDTIARAYSKAIKEIDFYALNMEAIEDAVYEAALKGYGIDAPRVFAGVEGEQVLRHKLVDVAWHKDGMKLSTRLHGVENVLRNNIKDTVQNALRTYKTVQQIADELYDGYGNRQDILREAELSKKLEELKKLTVNLYSGDKQAAQKSDLMKAIEHDAKKLKTPGMQAALNDVVEASETDSKSAQRKARKMTKLGANKEQVDAMLEQERNKAVQKALDVAAQEKSRYYAKRIARTESARSYFEGIIAADKDNDDVFGYEWRLSSAHVHTEKDCDCHMYTQLDVGYGKGVYPKDKIPELPAHPNCMCHLKKVFAWDVKHTDGKDKIPEQERGNNRVEEAAQEALEQTGATYGSYNDDNDPDGEKRNAHAKLYYEEIKNNGKGAFVDKISSNTGFSKRFVGEVYDHVFVDKHELWNGYKTFDASYDMAVSFQRLKEGDFTDTDILLLRHEHLERAFEKRYNMKYEDAHNIAERKYNYSLAIKKEN